VCKIIFFQTFTSRSKQKSGILRILFKLVWLFTSFHFSLPKIFTNYPACVAENLLPVGGRLEAQFFGAPEIRSRLIGLATLPRIALRELHGDYVAAIIFILDHYIDLNI
jgi:hypothetical protein